MIDSFLQFPGSGQKPGYIKEITNESSITIEDVEDKVNISVDYGKKGVNHESYAHYLALSAMERISEIVHTTKAEEER